MNQWLKRNPMVVLLVPLIALIISCTYWHWPMTLPRTAILPTNDTTRAFYTLCLTSAAVPRTATMRYEAQVLSERAERPTMLVYIQGDSTTVWPEKGDTLMVYTSWQRPDSIGDFDYATYLYRQGITATGYVNSWGWQVMGHHSSPWWRDAAAWQRLLKERYRTLGIPSRELGTISALTLGYREDLDEHIKRQFSASGAMHVLAVSGLHTHILMTMLMGLITLFGRCKPLYEERGKQVALGVVIIGSLVAYAWLAGGTPSVVRSVVMCSMMVLAGMLRRDSQMMNALIASGWLILLVNPMDLYSVSFQLSFAAVLAIILFAPGWNRVMPKNYVLGLIGMSIAAMIGTLPLTLYYYGQLSNYFLLTNLIVLPLAWCMMIGGLFTLTIGWITPIGCVLAWVLKWVTWLMNEAVSWIESLPYATTMVELPLWGMWLLIGFNMVILIVWNKITNDNK